jgi:hypothetical protein
VRCQICFVWILWVFFGSGLFELRAQFDPITGERVRLTLIKALKNLHNGEDETRTHKQLLADAIEQAISSPAGDNQTTSRQSPAGGGVDLMVTVTLDDLIAGLNATGKLVGTDETGPQSHLRRLRGPRL